MSGNVLVLGSEAQGYDPIYRKLILGGNIVNKNRKRIAQVLDTQTRK